MMNIHNIIHIYIFKKYKNKKDTLKKQNSKYTFSLK